VRLPDGRQERHLIDAVSVNLATDAQSIITRSQFDPATPLGAPGADRLYYGTQAWRQLDNATVRAA
jgi:hypothetical protein